MKKTLLLLFILFTAAAFGQDYKKEWAKVLEKETEGEVKQATTLTDAIYKKAKRNKNQPQVIKAFFFKAKYMQVIEEDAQFKIIENLRADIKNTPYPAKAILESLYAQMLGKIYNKYKYAIQRISSTANYDAHDYRKWSSKNYEDEIEKAYKESLDPADLLYRTPLTYFDEIIDFAPSLRNSKRSLYDFLAEQYLEYIWSSIDIYSNDYCIKNISLLFGPTEEFLKLKVHDSLAPNFSNGLKLLAELENHDLKNHETVNLERSVLRRLELLDQKITVNQKIITYLSTIHTLSSTSEKKPATYIAKFVEIQLLLRQADKKTFNQNIVEAMKLCDELIATAENHDFSTAATNLKTNYLQKEASIQIENYIKPHAASLAQIRFKNLDNINILFYKIPHDLNFDDPDSLNKYIKGKKPVVQKKYRLPNKQDHFFYTTEILLPTLEKGTYAVQLVPAGENFDISDSQLIEKITVSNISLIDQTNGNQTTFQVVDRSSGKPIENAKAVLKNFPEKFSDKGGRLTYTAPENYSQNYYNRDIITITRTGDTLSHSAYISDNRPERKELIPYVQLFTDRSIYRPGQTVYFKGIAYKDYKGKYSVLPDTYFTITIENEKSDELKKTRLKTNEFGSFTDSINLPKNLTGRFEINVDEDENAEYYAPLWNNVSFYGTRTHFQVEEYKRPTFEVTFEKIKREIRLNEKITIKGVAKSLTNAAISGAEVEYTVVRESKKHWYDNYENDAEITNGETITDANGQFTIEFNAKPNDEYKPENLPIFTYRIEATITDINGETHSQNYSVNAGYHSLNIYANLPVEINTAKKAIVNLGSNNLNGEFVPVLGTVNIYKVASLDKIYTDRPFVEPEIQIISKKEFEINLPYIPYITLKDSIIKQSPLLSKKINTGISKELVLDGLGKWKSGEYEVVFTATDSLGNEVSSNRRFTLRKNSDAVPADNKRFDYEITNIDYANDGYVEIEITSGIPLSVSVSAISDDILLYDKQIEINALKKKIRIPVLKNPRTNMGILLSYVWQNKLYKEELTLNILRKMEKLSIETQTLTTKLLPASSQTWSFSIIGSKTPLEVLASMYDASLDRLEIEDNYSLNTWNALNTNNYYNNHLQRSISTTGISSTSFTQKLKYLMHTKNSDSFYTYGFDFDGAKNSYYLYTPKTQSKVIDGYTIYGEVTDESGMPVPGATVTIEGTSQGLQTDFDGKYTLYANIGERIVFSYIGMETQRVVVINRHINVKMKDNAQLLEDVIVEAYRATTRRTSNIATTTVTSKTIEGRPNANFIQTLQGQVPGINISTGSGTPGATTTIVIRGAPSLNGTVNPLYIIDGVPLSESDFKKLSEDEIGDLIILKDKDKIAIYGPRGANGVILITTKKGIEALQQVKARKNFNETAFFYPQLRTDKNGKFSFSFTTPEALTEWKLRLLAHNKNAASSYYENTFFTQKDLMIVPNMPRFLREKDTIVLIAKITNLTNEIKTGNALLQLFDASSMKPADAAMMNTNNLKPFTIPAKGNTTVSWKITIPKGMQGMQYKVLAKAGEFIDGEENILPVLTNGIMVTESIPLWVKPNSVKKYSFENFDESLFKTGITQIGLTLEYTSNTTWLALQSLPYLMEFEHECAEQIFSRYYANAIAGKVIESTPALKEVFNAWRKADKPLSKFEQNEELKSIIMTETPWILDNQSDETIKNRLATLMDLDNMKVSLENSFKKLQNKQSYSGGFPWFDGGTENNYITRHIVSGFGHLTKIGIDFQNKKAVDALTKKAVAYIDGNFIAGNKLQKTATRIHNSEMSYNQLHYLYARSFYIDQYPMPDSLKKLTIAYINNINTSTAYNKYKWLNFSLYEKAMAALIMKRYGFNDTAKKILVHLRETSSTNEDWGMYWIENKAGWNWYQAPVETQALLIEAFMEVDNDVAAADAMKVWLLKNKQNKNWPTTKSTTEAVYALLLQGSNWSTIKDNTTFKLGDQESLTEKLAQTDKEAGTGHIKLQFTPNEIKTGMGSLIVENKSSVPGFGGLYWQRSYDNIEDYSPQSEGILLINKELYIKVNTATGVEIKPITKEIPLKVGDLVTVRLIITAKEDMQYLHLKDTRASAFEPVNVISEYKWIKGISYYQSTRDASSNFFFDNLNKGYYVIEYDVRVNNSGEFSNGMATIQSMYAPEFKGNSKSKRIQVE